MLNISRFTSKELAGLTSFTGKVVTYDPSCCSLTVESSTKLLGVRPVRIDNKIGGLLLGYKESTDKHDFLFNLGFAYSIALMFEIPFTDLPLFVNHEDDLVSSLSKYRLSLGK